jgi:hypothetical protein
MVTQSKMPEVSRVQNASFQEFNFRHLYPITVKLKSVVNASPGIERFSFFMPVNDDKKTLGGQNPGEFPAKCLVYRSY